MHWIVNLNLKREGGYYALMEPQEPETDADRVTRFVKPQGVLLTERAEVLARVYAGAQVRGYNPRETVYDYLRMLDGME